MDSLVIYLVLAKTDGIYNGIMDKKNLIFRK